MSALLTCISPLLLSAALALTDWPRIYADILSLAHLSSFFLRCDYVPSLANSYELFVEFLYFIGLLIFDAFEIVLANTHLERIGLLFLLYLLFQRLLVILLVVTRLHQSFRDLVCEDRLLVFKIVFGTFLSLPDLLVVVVSDTVHFCSFVLIVGAFGFAQP